jgi:PAS domain-containing protein
MLDWFNDRVYRFSGLTFADLEGNGWTQLLHADDLGAASRALVDRSAHR